MSDDITKRIAENMTDAEVRLLAAEQLRLVHDNAYSESNYRHGLLPIYVRITGVLTTPPKPDRLDLPVTGEDVEVVDVRSGDRVCGYCLRIGDEFGAEARHWVSSEGWSLTRCTWFYDRSDAIAQRDRLIARNDLPRHADGRVMTRREVGIR